MKNKILMFAILGMFLLSFASAGLIGTFKVNNEMEITNYCQDGTCTYMNLTSISLPNNTIIYPNAAMVKNYQDFSYTYTPTLQGTYTFTTCGNPSGVVICDSDTFESTPSGRDGSSNMIFFIVVILLLYTISFLGFFKKNIPMTILGGMALMFLGVYMIQNGIIIYRDNLTNYIGYVTIAWGAISSLWALVEEYDL